MRNDAHITRRRALNIVAAMAGLPLMIAGLRATARKPEAFTWRGEVLGAPAELSLWHSDAAFARRTIVKVRGEIERLERIVSLYRSDSEIARLNASGKLIKPSPELRALIEDSQRLSALSSGAFDISVQPLWRLYEAHFWSHTAVEPDIAARARDVARALVDYRSIDAGAGEIALARPHMTITLNSVAQGFITDAVTDLLRNEGFESAVVDMGEFRTIGRHPDGRPWRLGIRDATRLPSSPATTQPSFPAEQGVSLARGREPMRGRSLSAPTNNIARTVELADMALAVSGGYGTTFDDSGRFHHIFDPKTGASANALIDVVVIAPKAVIADGLATAICAAGESLAPTLLAAYPNTRAILTRLDGTSATLGSSVSTVV